MFRDGGGKPGIVIKKQGRRELEMREYATTRCQFLREQERMEKCTLVLVTRRLTARSEGKLQNHGGGCWGALG